MAQTEEISLLEFQNKFSDEEACKNYLFTMRWPNGFSCPKCAHERYIHIKTRNLFECKSCRYQASLTTGTVMHRTRTSVHIWFWMIYLIACDKRGHSALDISKKLGISYYKAWTNEHKIRKAMSDRDEKYQLCGLVELDDAYFSDSDKSSDEDKKRGRGTDKSKVIVAVSTSENEKPQFVKMYVADNLDSNTIEDFVSKTITKDTTIKSDGLNIYSKLPEKGYTHIPRVTKNDDDLCSFLPWVHTVISNAKSFLQGTYHVGMKSKYLQAYLDEFCYRFNRRFWENQLFGRLTNACLTTKAVTFAELTG